MNKPTKIINGVLILGLLVLLIGYFFFRPTATPSPAGQPPALPPSTVKPKASAPMTRMEPPKLPAVPANATETTTSADAEAASKIAAADIAGLLRQGDFAAVVEKYALPDEQKDILNLLQTEQAEGESGQIRLRQLARVFEGMAGQTPAISENNTRATFYDRSTWGISPPVFLKALPPGTDPDPYIRIRVDLVQRDGQWYFGSGIGMLFSALHNVPIDKMAEANP